MREPLREGFLRAHSGAAVYLGVIDALAQGRTSKQAQQKGAPLLLRRVGEFRRRLTKVLGNTPQRSGTTGSGMSTEVSESPRTVVPLVSAALGLLRASLLLWPSLDHPSTPPQPLQASQRRQGFLLEP